MRNDELFDLFWDYVEQRRALVDVSSPTLPCGLGVNSRLRLEVVDSVACGDTVVAPLVSSSWLVDRYLCGGFRDTFGNGLLSGNFC